MDSCSDHVFPRFGPIPNIQNRAEEQTIMELILINGQCKLCLAFV